MSLQLHVTTLGWKSALPTLRYFTFEKPWSVFITETVSEASLKQVEKFKYLAVVFTSDRRQAKELDTRMGKASVVMQALQYLVIIKWELSIKAKLSIFKTVFVPILTYGHESWISTKRIWSQVQVYEMRFSYII